MITRRAKIATCVALAVLCYTHEASSEPLRLHTPARCVTEGGSTVDIAPRRYLPEPDWTALDIEIRRLQERETHLAAENASLRASVQTAPPRSTWIVAGLALVAGIAAGIYASDHR